MKRKILRSRHSSPEPKEFCHLDGVIYGLDYAKNPQIQAAIEQFKYRFTQKLSVYFAALIVEKLGELVMTKGRKIRLIPVPLHPKRLNYRGFNQALVIAKAIQVHSPEKIEVLEFLQRIKNTTQQAKLHKKERQKNLLDALCMNKKFVQHTLETDALYFLVDDVCTTGATLENAAQILKQWGIPKVYGLVVARAFKLR
ncbi:MAG: hypothetical protein V1908_00850 [Candidatus Peregrinibacteria bacterium]